MGNYRIHSHQKCLRWSTDVSCASFVEKPFVHGHIHLYRGPHVNIEKNSGSRKTKRRNATDNRIRFIIVKVSVDEQDLQSTIHNNLRVDISQRT